MPTSPTPTTGTSRCEPLCRQRLPARIPASLPGRTLLLTQPRLCPTSQDELAGVQAGVLGEVDHEVLFRVSETADGEATYVPRVVMMDTRGALGSLSRLGGPPAGPSLATKSAQRPPRVQPGPRRPNSSFARSLALLPLGLRLLTPGRSVVAAGTLYNESAPAAPGGGYQALSADALASAGVWGGGVHTILQVPPGHAARAALAARPSRPATPSRCACLRP